MAKVELRHVTKSYGQLQVIHGIDMQVTDGEFIVIVGPSGCGKSTLLRMVAGLEPITGGEIVIGLESLIPRSGTEQPTWNLIMAGAMMALLPPVAVIIFMQRWFVKGLVESDK